MEYDHARLEVILVDSDDVKRLLALGHELLFGEHSLDCNPLVAEPPGAFVVLGGRRFFHLNREGIEQLVVVALQKPGHAFDESLVSLSGNGAHARTRAPVYVEQQTRRSEGFVVCKLGVFAGPNGKSPQQQVERSADCICVRIGAKILDILAPTPPHDLSAWPLVTASQCKIGKRLVVDQPNVKAGTMFLDERILEHECLDLGAGDDPFHLRCGRDHGACSRLQLGREVVGESMSEHLCFADVQHLVMLIAEYVRAGRVRYRRRGWTREHVSMVESHTVCFATVPRSPVKALTGPSEPYFRLSNENGQPQTWCRRRSCRLCRSPRGCGAPLGRTATSIPGLQRRFQVQGQPLQ